uniref:Uncharacterized protein n=1 Tax=Neisseria meningitidis alpha153 TaxID=663926 RepID=C6SG20_NEIME|nr:hypothetical protein predicted by Glimmer/Critica [Neisseria meningitidis alpha153]
MQYKPLSDGICRLKAFDATNRQIIFVHWKETPRIHP